ncbi:MULTISPECIES: GNAT family N-acetyltransferase [unclassified Fusibacter]|uniref:GNAT family N-acetyltransferase n=1 Tax=unclassified Fusibacter TaxID=2624464 RepID=UPI001011E9C4|nr:MULTISPECIES: GNAT family N-acetyltransferase [unclassified Fusibacter]MCK8060760.1 GNAT family N-acetyltransferase [Fusibacter sp. A2]NPE23056.1 GNAT family N-acetyltransferase [Fusibacter sp. A1]RXV59728.1 GNAT family N-acetyltransferase [Fusibacter sp. A1]
MLTSKELTSDTWHDFEKLFGKHKGVHGGCWCMWHRLRSVEFNKLSKEERRMAYHDETMAGNGCGIIVYDGSEPVAWCQFGKPSCLKSYDFGRVYPKLDLPSHLKPDWRISCIFVDKDRRHEQLASYALNAAIEVIRKKGDGVVEAFPLKSAASGRPQYTGSKEMFEKHGFEDVMSLTANTDYMRAII